MKKIGWLQSRFICRLVGHAFFSRSYDGKEAIGRGSFSHFFLTGELLRCHRCNWPFPEAPLSDTERDVFINKLDKLREEGEDLLQKIRGTP